MNKLKWGKYCENSGFRFWSSRFLRNRGKYICQSVKLVKDKCPSFPESTNYPLATSRSLFQSINSIYRKRQVTTFAFPPNPTTFSKLSIDVKSAVQHRLVHLRHAHPTFSARAGHKFRKIVNLSAAATGGTFPSFVKLSHILTKLNAASSSSSSFAKESFSKHSGYACR